MARRPADPDVTPFDLAEFVRQAIPPVHPAGRPFIAAGLLAAGVALRRPVPRNLALGFALASAAFFRHPARVTPDDATAAFAAADGEIVAVDEAAPPTELEWTEDLVPRVSTFLSLFDVHVQRSPAAAQVVRQVHTPGRFLAASKPEASEANERNAILFRTDAGLEFAAVQVAGLIARRIVSQVEEGQALAAGETYGLIRFGSRVDLYLPLGATPLVRPGQRSVGGETVVARLP